MGAAVVLGLWWCAAVQDSRLPLRLAVDDRYSYGQKESNTDWAVEMGPRFYLLQGSTGAGGDAGTWDQVFRDGGGIRVEVAYEHLRNSTWSLGAYASIAQIFLHEGEFVDPLSGTDVIVDEARTFPFLLGPQGAVRFGAGFFADARTGFGVVYHRSSEADTVSGSRSFIDSSVSFAWEVGAHVAWKVPNDNKGTIGIFVGMGYQIWGAPEFNEELFPGFDGKWMQATTVDFGLWFGY